MRSPLDKSATPSEKLDFVFSHICNFTNSATGRKNDEGGAVIDFTAAYMSFDHNYFGLNSYEEMKAIFVCEKKDFEENKKHFDVNHYPFLCYDSFAHLTDLLTSEIGAYIA